MTLGRRIALYRKELGITQDALAQKLEVTNQAVSKWESDQSCPDIMLIPKLADIFNVSLDELFGREWIQKTEVVNETLPWEDDGVLHMVLYKGRTLLKNQTPEEGKKLCFVLEGDALNVNSNISVEIQGSVEGNVAAGAYVECNGGVAGNVAVGSYLKCGGIAGDVAAGSYIECGGIAGHVTAGDYVECGDVSGNIEAGGNVDCNNVEGDIEAKGCIDCNNVGGNARAYGHVECNNVGGNVEANGNVECGDISGNVIINEKGKVIRD